MKNEDGLLDTARPDSHKIDFKCLAILKKAESSKKLHCLAGPTHLGLLGLI